ncbi:MAG: hypothetical protein ACK559_11035, partial [bacterium]
RLCQLAWLLQLCQLAWLLQLCRPARLLRFFQPCWFARLLDKCRASNRELLIEPVGRPCRFVHGSFRAGCFFRASCCFRRLPARLCRCQGFYGCQLRHCRFP